MWEIDNRTPFAASRQWVRGLDGTEISIVVVKSSFEIRPDGSVEVSAGQPPPLLLPEYHGEPGHSSLKYEADFPLAKATTDVIVVAKAHAPGGAPATQVDVGLRVGPIRRMLRVFGDRTWSAGGATSPRPFTTMPIVYERAYGGGDPCSDRPERDWDWRNPVGCGYAVSHANSIGRALPNIEDPTCLIGSWSDRPAPAGFGALCGHWQPRASWAGTYGDAWRETRQPLLPEDFDQRYFQAAPVPQQAPSFLRGGEPVVLLNLDPSGRLAFSLPKLYLGFETHYFDGTREVHKHRKLHTVILEPDAARVSLVWHSPLPCHFKAHRLESTTITLKIDASTGMASQVDDGMELA